MDAITIISIIGGAIGIIGLAGGAVGYFAKGRGDSIIAYQAQENGILKDNISRLEKSVTALTTERNTLTEANSTLRNLAQGSPSIEKLARQISRVLNRLEKAERERNNAKV